MIPVRPIDALHRELTSALAASATVMDRQPGTLFQIDLPAYMGDGDAAEIYVKRQSNGDLTITDMGATRTRRICDGHGTVDDSLATLAEKHGFALRNGEICATIQIGDLLSTALRLLQVEWQAELLSKTSR